MGRSLQAYAVAQDKIGAARLAQDSAITNNFYKPWTSTLNNQINAAVKARQHVKSARLSLDAARAKYKHLSGANTGAATSAGASAQKIEQARLEVEAAEETLVTATEEAINLMRAVLDNVSVYAVDMHWECSDLYCPLRCIFSLTLSSPCLLSSKRSKNTTLEQPKSCRELLIQSKNLLWRLR